MTEVKPSLPASSSSSFAAVRARAPRQALVHDDRSVRCRVGKVCEGWRACPSKHLGGHEGAENGAADADSEDPLGCVTSAPERTALVRAAIKDSWDAYAASAFGADELAPLSKAAAPPWFDLGLTLVDAMDTLLLAGLREEYLAARAWVGAGAADGTQKGGRHGSGGGAGNLPSSDSKNAAKPGSREAGGLALDPDKEVNLFETTIRVLGGLLAAAHLEPRWLPQRQRRGGSGGNGSGSGSGGDGKSDGGGMALPLLSAAAQLGIRLSPALDGVGGIEILAGGERRRKRRSRNKKKEKKTAAAAKGDGSGTKPSSRRVPLSDVSLRRLEAAGPAWTSFSSLSEATTLSMEFSFLSRATGGRGGARNGGDETEEDNDGLLKAASAAALSAARSVAASAASTIDPPSLPPIYVDPDSGTFHSGVVTLGARGDSYYEYLLKQWLLGGKKGEGEKERNLAFSSFSSSASTGDGVSRTQKPENDTRDSDDDFDDDDDDGIWMRDAYVASMRSLRARLVARAPLPTTHEGAGEGARASGGGGNGAGAAALETVPSLQRRRGGLAYVRELINGADSPKMDHLVCFLPGLLALGAAHGVDTRRRVSEESSSSSLSSTTTAALKTNSSSSSFHPDDDEDVALAAQLALTCAEMYRAVPAGLAPEIVHFRERRTEGEEGKKKEGVIPGVGVANEAASTAEKTTSEDAPEVGHGAFDVKPADAHNLLRPESVESWFLLWRLTGDEAYREWGWAAFRAWSRFSRVRGGPAAEAAVGGGGSDGEKHPPSVSLGFANLDSVLEVPPRQRDKMESFWVAETLKYLYLMFDDEAAAGLPLVRRVFFFFFSLPFFALFALSFSLTQRRLCFFLSPDDKNKKHRINTSSTPRLTRCRSGGAPPTRPPRADTSRCRSRPLLRSPSPMTTTAATAAATPPPPRTPPRRRGPLPRGAS